MQIAINNIARTELAIAGSSFVPLTYKEDKNGNIKMGSYAKAVAFASKAVREDIASANYVRWLTNGQYRPIISDVMDELVPKSARPFVSGIVPESGPVSKDMFTQFCIACVGAVEATGKEPKGKKAYYYGVCKRVVDATRADEGQGDVVAEQ